MTEIQKSLPIAGLPSYEDSELPSYGEALKLPSDYIKCPNDTYRLFTASKSGSPTPWTITETITTAPGTPPPPPPGRNRVHPDTIIEVDGEDGPIDASNDSKDSKRWLLFGLICFSLSILSIYLILFNI